MAASRQPEQVKQEYANMEEDILWGSTPKKITKEW